jgi:hypothetical protein
MSKSLTSNEPEELASRAILISSVSGSEPNKSGDRLILLYMEIAGSGMPVLAHLTWHLQAKRIVMIPDHQLTIEAASTAMIDCFKEDPAGY